VNTPAAADLMNPESQIMSSAATTSGRTASAAVVFFDEDRARPPAPASSHRPHRERKDQRDGVRRYEKPGAFSSGPNGPLAPRARAAPKRTSRTGPSRERPRQRPPAASASAAQPSHTPPLS
jgi:hypothetical protein